MRRALAAAEAKAEETAKEAARACRVRVEEASADAAAARAAAAEAVDAAVAEADAKCASLRREHKARTEALTFVGLNGAPERKRRSATFRSSEGLQSPSNATPPMLPEPGF